MDRFASSIPKENLCTMSDVMAVPSELTLEERLALALQQIQTLSERLAIVEERLLLVSDVDKYQTLQNYLKQGDFKAADLETSEVILSTVAKTRENLTPEDMMKFPCDVLQVIDRLWRTYSDGRFGLSVQLSFYLEGGGTIDTLRAQDVPLIQQFGDRVGWRQNGQWRSADYDNWDFSLTAAPGCFPAIWWKSPYGLKMVTYCFMRLLACEIHK
jgi:hypothetical protein